MVAIGMVAKTYDGRTLRLVVFGITAWLLIVVCMSTVRLPKYTYERAASWRLKGGGGDSSMRVNPPPLPLDVQENVHLTFEQCQQEFPLLFDQLDENAQIWQSRGGIKQAFLDEAMDKCRLGCMRLIIKDGLIYVKRFAHPMQTRVQEVMTLFKTAVEGASWDDKQAFDGVELVFNAFDFEDDVVQNQAAWLLTKKESQRDNGQYLLPDFGFGAWPEAGIGTYAHFRREAKAINERQTWRNKSERAYFRGDPYVGEHGNSARKDLIQQTHMPGADVWADVARTSFGGTDPNGEPITKFIRIEEHCKHRYLLHSEGVSYSGRSKFILGCASTVITHQLQWTQHFHPALNSDPTSPDQNVIVSPGHDFENLATLVLDLQKQDRAMFAGLKVSQGYKVAQNANRTLVNRYLTPASLACYVRGALRSYSSALDRSSFNDGEGPRVEPGGGVAQWLGERPMSEIKDSLHGDMDITTWAALGHPEYPPLS